MELQKQPILATKEQLRLAEITQTSTDTTSAHDDIALQKRVKKVIELTRCTPSQAEVALIDCEGNIEEAVSRLLDNPDELVLWSQQGKNRKPKPSSVSNDGKKNRSDSQRNRTRHDGFKGQVRGTGGGGGGGYRRDRGSRDNGSAKDREGAYQKDGVYQNKCAEGMNYAAVVRSKAQNGWTNGGTGAGDRGESTAGWEDEKKGGAQSAFDWGESTGWEEEKKSGGQSTFTAAEPPGPEPNEDWKSGPRVFMPSSACTTATTMVVTEDIQYVSPQQTVVDNSNFGSQPQENVEFVTDEALPQDSTSFPRDSTSYPQDNTSYHHFKIADQPQEKVEFVTDYAPDFDHPQAKVEFVTGDTLPPTSTTYQFGFNFASTKEASTWGLQQPIASVEVPSTSVTAHFTTSPQQQVQPPIEAHQRINAGAPRNAAALSFTDTASVNFPPSAGGTGQPSGASATSGPAPTSAHAHQPSALSSVAQQQQAALSSSAAHSQQLQNKPSMYVPSNASMVAAAPHHLQQHLQQQQQAPPPQTMFHHHQTSAAPAAAVPQFPNYNMQYMYSPVAAAPTMAGPPNSELDRFLIHQYGAPYSQLEMQMGAMSLGTPTTLAPSHRALESYMDNKFGQQQPNVSQGGNTGPYQQPQQNQQQRNLGQSETATLMGGPPGHVGPPPGFGMPTAPTQPSYMQTANIHSLFQMPTFAHPYQQHHQYMMSNANRLQAAQRPTQTSPPEGNGPPPRRGNETQAYGTGGGGVSDVSGDQHSNGGGGGPQQYNNPNFNKPNYRPYM